jgi:DNA primase
MRAAAPVTDDEGDMAFSRAVLSAIKDQADILQLIGEKVALTPAGANHKGLCPFHHEKSPSFTVHPGKRLFHCFGCGVGGGVVDFVMRFERVEFPEAVRLLAGRLGIALEESGGRPGEDTALAALQTAQGYYHDLLLRQPGGEPGRAYLRERAVDEQAWTDFGLGFAVDDWRGLTQHAQRKGLALPDLLAGGLVRTGPQGNTYDLLRKRVVFPISNERGKAIAFGGRVIAKEDSPKYINSPETRFYRKHQVLFGLHQGQAALRQGRRAILVEGYLDVIRLHRNGFREAVATCGTALTEDHLKLLERYADQVLLVFDGDEAGIKAALRSAPLFLNRGVEARVVLLPDGLDPDDYVQRDGAEAFAQQAAQAVPLLEFLAFQTLRRNGRTPQGRDKSLQALLPVLSAVKNEALRDVTVRHVADLIEVRADSVFALLRPASRGGPGTDPRERAAAAAGAFRRETRHQRMFLHLLLKERALLGRARELLRPDELTDPDVRALCEKMLRFSDEEFRSVDLDELAQLYPDLAPALRGMAVEEPRLLLGVTDAELELRNRVAGIKEEEKERLLQQLRRASGTEQEELATHRFVRLSKELRALRTPTPPAAPPAGGAAGAVPA